MKKTFLMHVEKIAHDGAALGTHEGKAVHVHGMLPGEEGIVEISKKYGVYAGILKELTLASTRRKSPEELHYLSCSPWQVMEYPLQVELKHALLQELFGYYKNGPHVNFIPATQFYGCRTKVEFSFTDREGESEIPLSLAFHVRGGGSARIPLPAGCALVSESMNRAALAIVEKLRVLGYAANDLKTLVIRESKSIHANEKSHLGGQAGKFLAILYAKKDTIAKFPVDDIPDLAGFFAFYSTEKSPASVETKALWRWGD
ncbi:MAG: hypothetical protein AAB869_00020, partial [Patescibacteria group bacterium]